MDDGLVRNLIKPSLAGYKWSKFLLLWTMVSYSIAYLDKGVILYVLILVVVDDGLVPYLDRGVILYAYPS